MKAKRARGVGAAQHLGWKIERHWALTALSLATVALWSMIFAPISLWPLVFICMVPWMIMIGATTKAPRLYFYSYVLALVFFLINMRWLYPATGAGFVALSIYQAAYFPLAAIPLRHVIRRRRWPLAIVLPIVWTGTEMLRAVVLSGFPWFFLSHSLYRVSGLIQISDLVGAYGVTFVAAAVNGTIADVLIAWRGDRGDAALGARPRMVRGGLVFAVAIVFSALIYGWWQLGRDTMLDGPRIAIVQGDFINAVDTSKAQGHDKMTESQKMETYLSMMRAASAEKPDLYLLPETPWTMYLNPEIRDFRESWRRSFAALQGHASEHDAVVVTGSGSLTMTPDDLLAKERRYNSATVFTPDGAEPGRYDKIHLVYFGEVVPFRLGRLRFLYFWLNQLMPFSGPEGNFEYSIFHGDAFRSFAMRAPSRDDRSYRFAVPICYEDVMPYLSREFVGAGGNRKRVDFLLNISNDGWFRRGIQQPQHLAICVFRAVENRVGIARSVNTGVSAFIQPSGRIHDVVEGDSSSPWPGVCAYTVANIGVDSRFTPYTRYGDWFAWSCALFWLALFVDYWVLRVRGRDEG